jgi:hypothetical protein
MTAKNKQGQGQAQEPMWGNFPFPFAMLRVEGQDDGEKKQRQVLCRFLDEGVAWGARDLMSGLWGIGLALGVC